MKRHLIPAWNTLLPGAAIALALVASAPSPSQAGEVPFGDKVGAEVSYYNRTTPHVSTGGLLHQGGPEMLKSLGYGTVIDLRTPKEGTAQERAVVEALGLRYINIPIANGAPTDDQIARFADVIAAPGGQAIHVHCVSANRAGAMWALYLAATGISAEQAVNAGRTVGLRGRREAGVRQHLGLPARP
ncbi:MAG: phosphatase [Alphaproteobacteria bacterium]|jgi:uncharacterized protein (TIGR01244 family)|nr:phosphatase [Alphaproteobacteria bacterium]